MLNTLYQLAETLEAHGVLEKPRNKDLTKVNGNNLLWVEFSPKGETTASIQENSGNLLKVSINNQNSWPVINGSIPIPPETSGDRKKLTEEENYLKSLDYLKSLPREPMLETCTELATDLQIRSTRSLTYLPEKSDLAKSAQFVSKALEDKKARIQLGEQIFAAIFKYIDQIVDPKAGKAFLKQAFKLGKQGTTLPIAAGRSSETYGILGGSLVEKAIALTEKKTTGNKEETGLFGTQTELPVLSGYPLMPSTYYPVSRAKDFPALHGYFGSGYAPIATSAMQKIRAALDYLTNPAKAGILHRRLNIDDKKFLIIACPKIAKQENLSQKLLDGIYVDQYKKLTAKEKQIRVMEFEEASNAALHPEENEKNPKNTTEITLLVLQETMKSNIQVVMDVNHSFNNWRRVVQEWMLDQHLPQGWKCYYGVSQSHTPDILQTLQGLQCTFQVPKGNLKTKPDKRTPESKGIHFQTLLKPKEDIPLLQLVRIQRTILNQLGNETLPSLITKKMQNPNGNDSTAVFDLNRTMGLLTLTTTRIQQQMSQEPLTENPSFLIGQCLQDLNKLEQAYRNNQEISRGQKQTAAPRNMRGSRLVNLAERANISLTMASIQREAKAYLDLADHIVRKKYLLPEAERNWTRTESQLTSAAKSFRINITTIGEKTVGFTKTPQNAVEIQQHTALVLLGLNARKPKQEKETNENKPQV